MSSFADTISLEREFLKAITSSVIMARTYLHQATESLFTSDERKFIYVLANSTLEHNKSVLTESVYQYEVGAKKPQSLANRYLAEWNLIAAISVYDAPESLLDRMREADTGRKALSIVEGVAGLLSSGDIEGAVSSLKRESMLISTVRESRPLVEYTDIQFRHDIIQDKKANPEKYRGIRTGFSKFDNFTGGLFPAELTLLAGITGLGKSTLCRNIAKNIITLNEGKNVLYVCNEEYLEQVEYKLDAMFTDIPHLDFKRAEITDVGIAEWQNKMTSLRGNPKAGKLFIKEIPAFTDVTIVEQEFRALENRGIPIHVIIIDHLPNLTPIHKAWGENDERGKAAADCKELARWLKVSVVIPTQAATEVEKKQAAGNRAGRLDVYGSKAQIHHANTFIIITYAGTDDSQTTLEEHERDVFLVMDVKKQRDGPPFYLKIRHKVKVGTFIDMETAARASEVVDQIDIITKEAEKPREESVKWAEQVEGVEDVSESSEIQPINASHEAQIDLVLKEVKPEIKQESKEIPQEVHKESSIMQKIRSSVSAKKV